MTTKRKVKKEKKNTEKGIDVIVFGKKVKRRSKTCREHAHFLFLKLCDVKLACPTKRVKRLECTVV